MKESIGPNLSFSNFSATSLQNVIAISFDWSIFPKSIFRNDFFPA